MKMIHKVTVSTVEGVVQTIPGVPRTIGLDASDRMCVWYETGEPTQYVLLFTGSAVPDGFEVKDSCLFYGLMWHLAVRA